MLSVNTLRKLTANVVVSQAPYNALKVNPDGLYLEGFTPVGACAQAFFTVANAQQVPITGAAAVPSSSIVGYTQAVMDTGLARAGTAMFDGTVPSRLTIRKAGLYLVSTHGKYQSSGTYSRFSPFAWISLNGDDTQALASSMPGATAAVDPATLGAPPGQGSTVELYTGTYHAMNTVRLAEGDYIETRVAFVSLVASPANTVLLTSVPTAAVQQLPHQTLAAVQVGV